MNNGYILLLAPRPAGAAQATSIPVVCEKRATKQMPAWRSRQNATFIH